jgi:hypothetical protein
MEKVMDFAPWFAGVMWLSADAIAGKPAPTGIFGGHKFVCDD